MRGDAAELHHHDANQVRALRNVIRDAQELFNAEAVDGFLEDRGNVVHTGTERHALRPRTVFHRLLNAGMKVAGVNAGFANGFAVEFENQTQNAMGCRVNRAKVNDDALGGNLFDFVQNILPVATLGHDLRNFVHIQRG